jgi:tellurite resistance protein TerA
MGLFGFGKKEEQPEASGPVASAPVNGAINLSKGGSINMKKTAVIRATASWSSKTDYDLYALVLLKTGEELVVSTFGSKDQPVPTPSVLNGAVKHLGDVGREAKGKAQEVIEIRMTDEIDTIIPIAYSAQGNGIGSFRQYKVSLEIDNNEGTRVSIDASSASMNPLIYTLAIGAIRNTPEGVTIEHLEKYSSVGSEKRPTFVNGQLQMDAGSVNQYK